MPDIHFRYIVEDVQSAIEFYTAVLGFEVDAHPAPGFAVLKKDHMRLFLNQPGAGGAGQQMPEGDEPKPGGWNRIQLQVEDLDSLYNELKSKKAVFRSGIIEGKGGIQVILEGPSGNPIELFEPKKNTRPSNSYKPKGYSTITPYLAIKNAGQLVGFLKKVFNAEEHRLMRGEDGSFMHGEFRIGDSLVMIGDVQGRHDPFPGMLYVYIPDVDKTYKKAIEEGATSIEEPENQDYGDRRAAFADPSGNSWYIASQINTQTGEGS